MIPLRLPLLVVAELVGRADVAPLLAQSWRRFIEEEVVAEVGGLNLAGTSPADIEAALLGLEQRGDTIAGWLLAHYSMIAAYDVALMLGWVDVNVALRARVP